MPSASRAARSASGVVPAEARQLLVAEPGALDGGEQLGGLGVGRGRRAARRSSPTSRSSATFRPISARNQAEMPVASPTTGSGTPRRSRPSSRHSRESDGSRNRRRTRGAAVRCAWRVDSQAWPLLVDPVDRLVRVRVAGVDAGEVVERRGPARVLGQRPDPGLLETPERLVQRRAERPVDGHHLARGLHLAAERPVGGRELVEREARQLDDDVVERGLEGGDGRAGHDVRDLGEPAPDRDLGRDPGDRVARGLARERRRAATRAG